MKNLQQEIDLLIRNVPDFPKPGIMFKDITPILSNQEFCSKVIDFYTEQFKNNLPDAIVGIESRGFLFGMLLANKWQIPFVPIRKAGKLPHKTVSFSYDLEYGSATVEIHEDALKPNWKVMVHDDLLATGGTAMAASELINKLGATTHSFTFLVNLEFLQGAKNLLKYSNKIISVASYS